MDEWRGHTKKSQINDQINIWCKKQIQRLKICQDKSTEEYGQTICFFAIIFIFT
jgi:hypothetical protein